MIVRTLRVPSRSSTELKPLPPSTSISIFYDNCASSLSKKLLQRRINIRIGYERLLGGISSIHRVFACTLFFFQSKSIGDAAYETLWYNMTPAECQFLLFVILRSQKRLTITAGSVMDLSLEGFTTVRISPYDHADRNNET